MYEKEIAMCDGNGLYKVKGVLGTNQAIYLSVFSFICWEVLFKYLFKKSSCTLSVGTCRHWVWVPADTEDFKAGYTFGVLSMLLKKAVKILGSIGHCSCNKIMITKPNLDAQNWVLSDARERLHAWNWSQIRTVCWKITSFSKTTLLQKGVVSNNVL